MRTAGASPGSRASETPTASGSRHAERFRMTVLCAAFTLGSTAACAAFAEGPASIDNQVWRVALENDSAARAADKPMPDFSSEIEARKSYSIPALEILGFDFLLNQFNRRYIGSPYHTNLSTINRNLHHGWVVDNDPYSTNQFGHPYQGSMYHGFARSAGLNYWESLGYTFAGSAFWEIAGETTPPSRNDQIASGIAGSFLGESLFRMANLVLEKGAGVPRFWREVGAAAISPATGFNRLAFGDRFDTIFASRNPAYYGRLALGVRPNLSVAATRQVRSQD